MTFAESLLALRPGLVEGRDFALTENRQAIAFWHPDLPLPPSHAEIANRMDPRRPVPEEVAVYQLRIAVQARGLTANIEAAIDALPADKKAAARIAWDQAPTAHRRSPVINAIASALNLSKADVDAIFRAAAAIRL